MTGTFAQFVALGQQAADELLGHLAKYPGTGRDTYGGPLAPLTKPANEPAPRCRAWRIRFHDGTGATAVNTTDADHDEMLLIVCEQFGAERVAGVEPAG